MDKLEEIFSKSLFKIALCTALTGYVAFNNIKSYMFDT